MFTKVVRWKPCLEMFSSQFYEKGLSVRERNMKLLLETVTYIAIKESHLHNYSKHSHAHNILQKTPPV